MAAYTREAVGTVAPDTRPRRGLAASRKPTRYRTFR